MFERNSRAEEIFSAAWEQVRAGHSIESVVAQYPDLAADLEPMLRLAQAVRDTPPPALAPDAMARIQARARQIAVVQQARSLPPAFTAWETVLLGRTPHLNWLGQLAPADEAVSVAAESSQGDADVYSSEEEAGILERLRDLGYE